MKKSKPTKEGILAVIHKTEDWTAVILALLLGLLPTAEVIARKFFHTSVSYSADYMRHIVLILTFVSAMITSREKKHLSLSLSLKIHEPLKTWLHTAVMFLSTTITIAFTWSSLAWILTAFDPSTKIGFIPIRIIGMFMILGYIVIAFRFILELPKGKGHWYRFTASFGFLLGSFIAMESIGNFLSVILNELPSFMEPVIRFIHSTNAFLALPIIILLILSAIFGGPIFIILGGIAYMLFARQAEPLEIIANESYSMLISHSIPAIPLFTIAGFLLSESKASERLVRFFKAFFGWFPGGLAIMTIMVCAFFTTFTGASGVTILALGAILSFALIEGKYSRKFSIGLLTASGSVGLLFPPSLPIIIYGVIAGVSIKDMFKGGILPGVLMVLSLVIMSIVFASRNKIARENFKIKEAAIALRKSIWEILLPLAILLSYFGGLTNLEESSAIAVVYALIIEVLVHRDLKLKDLPNVILKGIPIIGGVLIILSLAKGLSYYIIDAEIPMKLTEWVQANISSKYIFLLLLNILLLITGCLMDIFSAIMVVVPLIIPVANAFGIHPVHLGIIFLANMELGYMTPPVGLNLFLASYRFNEPVGKLYRDVFPFLIIQLIAVLLITYIPFLATALL